jgi:hypothetical protein
MARADRGEDRFGAEDRLQRRLAGQRWRLLGLGGEERADVVGVAGDHRSARHRGAHSEDLAEATLGPEDVLDLALGEAHHLCHPGQGHDRGLGEGCGFGGLDGAGGRGRCLADEAGGERLRVAGGALGDGAHCSIVT